MKTIERKELMLAEISPHPYNREFVTIGEEWDEFVADVGEKGILVELVVRVHAEGYECLEGHRRRQAGLEAGLTVAVCQVVTASDEEAFERLWRGNHLRVNPDPVDEAKYVRGMMDLFGHTAAEVGRRMRHSVEWVRTRQRLLDLGEEVIEAVRRPDPRERLTMGAVEEILKMPEEYWPEAVQMVLMPELELLPLTADEARYELKRRLLEPKAREAAWEAQREKLQKSWRKELGKLCRKGTKEDLAVQVRSLADAARQRTAGMREAEEMVPLAEVLPGAPDGLRWLHVAVKHGLAVQVLPGEKDGESKAVVDGMLLREAEAAAAEHGTGEVWLVTGKKRTVTTPEDERVARAKAIAEGEGDPLYQDSGEAPPETVIEQKLEHGAWCDLTPVKQVALWAVSADADPMNAPDFVPKWACKLGVEGLWLEIDAITEWVMKLKR